MSLPKISCLCPTFNRVELLKEALQSFLIQDYPGEKELIILNDAPGQNLTFNHAQVQVVNMRTRAPSQIDKVNYCASLATGDLMLPWDDDDIYLSGRLSSVARHTHEGLYASDLFWTDPEPGKLTLVTHKAHANHGFRKDWFIRFGAYKMPPVEGCYDFLMNNYVREALSNVGHDVAPPEFPTYIYRKFGVDTVHVSAIFEDNPGYWEEYAEKMGNIIEGTFVLNPHWKRDWQGMADAAWAARPQPIPLDQIDKTFSPISGSESATASASQAISTSPAKKTQKKKAPAKKKAAKKAPAKNAPTKKQGGK